MKSDKYTSIYKCLFVVLTTERALYLYGKERKVMHAMFYNRY